MTLPTYDDLLERTDALKQELDSDRLGRERREDRDAVKALLEKPVYGLPTGVAPGAATRIAKFVRRDQDGNRVYDDGKGVLPLEAGVAVWLRGKDGEEYLQRSKRAATKTSQPDAQPTTGKPSPEQAAATLLDGVLPSNSDAKPLTPAEAQQTFLRENGWAPPCDSARAAYEEHLQNRIQYEAARTADERAMASIREKVQSSRQQREAEEHRARQQHEEERKASERATAMKILKEQMGL